MRVFIAWAARHGVDVDDALNRREARMKLRLVNLGGRRAAQSRKGSGSGRKPVFRKNDSGGLKSDSVTAESRMRGGT